MSDDRVPPHVRVLDRLFCAASLVWLIDLGVLDAIAVAPRSAVELAGELGLDAGAVARALDVLRADGWVVLDGERYTFAPSVVTASDRGPAPLPVALSMAMALRTHLRDGSALTVDTSTRGAAYVRSTPGLARVLSEEADHLAERLDRSDLDEILDVGAGAGTWSLPMARRRSPCRVTALDLPEVTEVFERSARSAGVRWRVVAGDYLEVEPPGAYDRVVLGNVLHLEGAVRARRLVERAAGWVRPGGDVVVVDLFPPVGAVSRSVAVYRAHLALRVAGGTVHAAEDVERWADAAGLVAGERLRAASHDYGSALVLRRPA